MAAGMSGSFAKRWKILSVVLLIWIVFAFIYLRRGLVEHSKNFYKKHKLQEVTKLLKPIFKPKTTDNPQVKSTIQVATTQPKLEVESPAKKENPPSEIITRKDPALELKLVAMIAKERLTSMEHGCRFSGKSYKLDVDALLKVEPRPRFYYSDKYKFLLCEVPKCGSTSWKKSMLAMEGILEEDPEIVPGDKAHAAAEKLNFWSDYNATDPASVARARERILNYTRVMTVREPLKRLVSAFKDKILSTGTGGEQYGNLSKLIHDLYKDGNALTGAAAGDQSYATWEEFVRYLIDPEKEIYMDAHWDFFSAFCHPCFAKYDYIIKLETVYHDIKYLSHKIGFNMSPFFPGGGVEERHRKKWESEYENFYSKLPKEDRAALYKMYQYQYALFGYPRPDFL